jgi:hypothetical protein
MKGWILAGKRHLVLEAQAINGSNGGRCIISADQAVHFCGFAEEGWNWGLYSIVIF